MRITREAARELIRSELALTKGLPSDAFMDDCMQTLREYGYWQLPQGWIRYTEPRVGPAYDFDMGEVYDLEIV